MKDANDIRRLLSVTINGLRRYEMEPPRAKAIIYGCSVLLHVIEQGMLEERLKAIEEAVAQGR